jgi:hypothetical protein
MKEEEPYRLDFCGFQPARMLVALYGSFVIGEIVFFFTGKVAGRPTRSDNKAKLSEKPRKSDICKRLQRYLIILKK